MKKSIISAVLLFFMILLGVVARSQTSDSFILLPYDSVHAILKKDSLKYGGNLQIIASLGVLSRYKAIPVTRDELESWHSSRKDTFYVVSLKVIIDPDKKNVYYPIKSFPSGEVELVPDWSVWDLGKEGYVDVKKEDVYFLFKK
ncbi:MAG: hypothetical protein V4665_00245 [Patescibacteria group bacterium]